MSLKLQAPTLYKWKTLDKVVKTMRSLKDLLEKYIMNLILLLSVKNKEMVYCNAAFLVTFFIGAANLLMMLLFYFCPIIPFSVAFGFQLLYRIVCINIFGRTTKQDLWALKCLEHPKTSIWNKLERITNKMNHLSAPLNNICGHTRGRTCIC